MSLENLGYCPEKDNNFPSNIQDHIREEQIKHPEATGALTWIVSDLSRVAKTISYLVNTAGIQNMYGLTGETNAHGESVLKLDARANEQFKRILWLNPHVAGYASEEEKEFVPFLDNDERRKYVVWFDPLDGSSNFDTNVSIGSIFSVYRRVTEGGPVEEVDFLQKGREQVCAGYFLYGSSTMFVYTTGSGVYGFTLDPSIGEFVLPDVYAQIKTPQTGAIYSINEGYSHKWEQGVRDYVQQLKTREDSPCSSRYVGSLVADFHRNLLKGGVYLYPADKKHPQGKLRLNCELNPLAFIAEQAGGMATDGVRRILDIQPESLHQKNPVVIGSKNEVKLYSQFV